MGTAGPQQPERMPEDMPDGILNRMSENILDRMVEDMPDIILKNIINKILKKYAK